jgi:hypothetical protein
MLPSPYRGRPRSSNLRVRGRNPDDVVREYGADALRLDEMRWRARKWMTEVALLV